ncbi:MAG: 1,4-beta-xylanase [Planctomycetota bacterium]
MSAKALLVTACVLILTARPVRSSEAGRWPAEKAWTWYRERPWLVGVNYLPSTACNTTEFWQAETFDEPTIRRELEWAQSLGFNTCRVFVQHLVWKHDPDGLKRRIVRFLELAGERGITTVPVLFDDCSFGDPPVAEPYLGKQKDPIPGMIASSWTPSPGLSKVTDRSAWPDLERYVRDLVKAFGGDRRVAFWDLYNEPGNSSMGEKSLPLVEAAFDWARREAPSQPLTVGVWHEGLSEMNRRLIELSDVVSFHAYTDAKGLEAAIRRYKESGRPVISTEWMARLLGSRFETDLALLKREAVGCYSWGLVNGRMQCQFPWWSKRGDPEPDVWFHDIFRRDGTPYDAAEVEAIRKATAEKKLPGAESVPCPESGAAKP